MTTTTLPRTRIFRLALGAALASTMLAGCAGKPAPSAAVSADGARTALAKGKSDRAVTLAEAAVLAAPHDAQTRALLGAAYLETGRFASAATALGDAMQLGDTSERTVLTYSLALSAAGSYAEAQALLAEHQARLDPADFGLAITLAGSPQQGIEVLSNALRYGNNTPKLRQNLAYAFALKGDWRSARLLAAQDVTADQLDQRLGEWAQMASPQMALQRVATLMGVTARQDGGQPVHLALSNFPTNEQLAAEAVTQQAFPAPETPPAAALAAVDAELPAADAIAAPSDSFAAAFAPEPVATSYTPAAPRIVLPRATPAPARTAARVAVAAPVRAQAAPRVQPAFVRQPGAYSVQLGSYTSMAAAGDAWIRFQKRHPELKGTDRVVTKALVNGRTYYRVAASGFARTSAASFCGLVRQGGGGCLAYATARPLPGAVNGAGGGAARLAAR